MFALTVGRKKEHFSLRGQMEASGKKKLNTEQKKSPTSPLTLFTYDKRRARIITRGRREKKGEDKKGSKTSNVNYGEILTAC